MRSLSWSVSLRLRPDPVTIRSDWRLVFHSRCTLGTITAINYEISLKAIKSISNFCCIIRRNASGWQTIRALSCFALINERGISVSGLNEMKQFSVPAVDYQKTFSRKKKFFPNHRSTKMFFFSEFTVIRPKNRFPSRISISFQYFCLKITKLFPVLEPRNDECSVVVGCPQLECERGGNTMLPSSQTVLSGGGRRTTQQSVLKLPIRWQKYIRARW